MKHCYWVVKDLPLESPPRTGAWIETAPMVIRFDQ